MNAAAHCTKAPRSALQALLPPMVMLAVRTTPRPPAGPAARRSTAVSATSSPRAPLTQTSSAAPPSRSSTDTNRLADKCTYLPSSPSSSQVPACAEGGHASGEPPDAPAGELALDSDDEEWDAYKGDAHLRPRCSAWACAAVSSGESRASSPGIMARASGSANRQLW